MPSIIRLNNCTIKIYFDDHNPPHFHVQGPDFSAAVNITTLTVMEGNASKSQLKEAVQWAQENQATLQEAWKKYKN